MKSSFLLIIFLLGLIHVTPFECSDVAELMGVDEAVNIIHKHIFPEGLPHQRRATPALCEQYTCCNISATNQCLLQDLKDPDFTLVLPGGKTRCIFDHSSPFAFQVFPGDVDKILFYFQGGGACFNKFSTDTDLCTPDCVPQPAVGIFDRKNVLNAFQNYTMYVFFFLDPYYFIFK